MLGQRIAWKLAVMSLCLAVSAGPTAAGATPPLPEPLLFETYRNELPQVSVTAITEDHDGYLWVGTEEGLVRFDGIEFEVFDRRNTPVFRSHAVRTLLVDRRGRLWIGTDSGGLARWIALVERIIDVHGGCVRAESAGPGQGSTFIFTLPGHLTNDSRSGYSGA